MRCGKEWEQWGTSCVLSANPFIVDHFIVYRKTNMSLRKGSKVIVIVGFLICFSCMGILYSNLSTTTIESQDMLNVKNRAIEQLKKEIEDRDTKSFTLENRILALERENTQCSEQNTQFEQKSQTLEQSLDELRAKASEVNANLRKLEKREEEEKTNHKADLQDNLNTLEDLKRELSKEKASTSSCVSDLAVLKGQYNRAVEERDQQSNELTKCLQSAGQAAAAADIKLVDSDKEDVAVHQVQAPVQAEAPKPQQVVDSVDHNAPAPVPAQAPVIGGGGALGDQIAALPNAIRPPREAMGGDNEANKQLVAAAPPPLQPAQPLQPDQFQIQPAQPAQEAFQPLPAAEQPQPLQPMQGLEAAQPALPQELLPAPQHPWRDNLTIFGHISAKRWSLYTKDLF